MSLRDRLRYVLSGAVPPVRAQLPPAFRGQFLVSLHDGNPHDPDTEVEGVGRRVVSFEPPKSPTAVLTSTEAFFAVPGSATFDRWALWRRNGDATPMHTGRLPHRERFSTIGGDFTLHVSLTPPDGLTWPTEVRL